MYKVFISHSSKDTWVAKQIQAHLKKLGVQTFLDEGHIEYGDDFESVIFSELKTCDELLVLLTPWALERPFIYMEIGAARINDLRIIGVLHGITFDQLNSTPGYPITLKKYLSVEINNMDAYFEQLKNRAK